MAWNEPGDNSNNNDRDPWGGRRGGGGGGGDRKGPPDLDEAFRKLQDSLNGLFGGKKRSGNGSGSGSGGKGGGLGLFGLQRLELLGGAAQLGAQAFLQAVGVGRLAGVGGEGGPGKQRLGPDR
mgnify:CR=1 FL=1